MQCIVILSSVCDSSMPQCGQHERRSLVHERGERLRGSTPASCSGIEGTHAALHSLWASRSAACLSASSFSSGFSVSP